LRKEEPFMTIPVAVITDADVRSYEKIMQMEESFIKFITRKSFSYLGKHIKHVIPSVPQGVEESLGEPHLLINKQISPFRCAAVEMTG
jgi:hypothetical protein